MFEYQYRTGCRTKSGGFTLVELLVVISIISMLMSILLPSLSRSREMGKRIVCLSNMRQLTMAWLLYTMDNDDQLCSPDTGWNNGLLSNNKHHWAADGPYLPFNTVGGTAQAVEDGVLFPYTEYTLGLYKCKSDVSNLVRSYSISNTMGGYTAGAFGGMSQITRPTERLVFIDADSIEPAGELKWIGGGFWPISDTDPATAKWDVKSYNNITARHSEGCNMSFADLHCEYRRWKDRRTVKLANRDFSPPDASDGNPDLQRMIEVLGSSINH